MSAREQPSTDERLCEPADSATKLYGNLGGVPEWPFIYIAGNLLLNSSPGVRLMDFSVHVTATGAFKYVIANLY